MTEVSPTQEKSSRLPLDRAAKLKLGAIATTLGLIVAGGGVGGYGAGQLIANSSRNGNIAAADKDKRCITDEGNLVKRGINPAAVSLASLTTVEVSDCGVSWAHDSAISNPYSNNETPQATIIGSSIVVNLPSTHSLEANRDSELTQATETYTLAGKIGSVVGGLLVTAFGGSGLLGWVDRRHHPQDPIPPVEVAAA